VTATACLIRLVWRFVKQKPWPLNCDYELALNLPRTGNFTEITMLANARIPYRGKDGPCVMSVETLCDLTCFSSSSSKVYGDNGFERAFDHEIMRTCKNYSYSSTLQIMALASVLGVPIEMVYPDEKNKLLPVYQNIFHRRQPFNQSSLAVRIMWTNPLGWPDRSKEFVVNHFVPLFNRSDQASVGKSRLQKRQRKMKTHGSLSLINGSQVRK